jgi:N utilization substance protein B
MYKRRDIREAAVQFLYFADLEGGADPSDMQETFWQITQENSLRKLAKAKAKAILHIAQGRESRIAKLSEHVPLALTELKAVGDLTALTVPLRALLRQESKLNAAIELLKSSTQSKTSDDLIESRLEDIFIANRVVKDARTAWDNALDDLPVWRNKLEAITAAATHLERISERFNGIDNLESTEAPAHGTEHLHASSQELTAFRKDTEALVQGVLSHKESLDEKLGDIVENYSPERVDPVDRAILRIGAYEIIHRDDIPRAVSINEAIEIAKRFGTTESSRFINGILDAL